eukprot:TRINITY_DN6035_c2_g2_i2.p1 TRINITY_DN6035_c2_g2~~TRINITY_DN6035_c2_g2_i2.p1  ORF type:complete len:428 (+),score=107.80 TRINITY_DN6035_c2_g2_i2:105-1388(+)
MVELVRRSPNSRPADDSNWRHDLQRGAAGHGHHGRGQPAEARLRGDGQPGVVAHLAADATNDSDSAADWLQGQLLQSAQQAGVQVTHRFILPSHLPPATLNHFNAGVEPPAERRVSAVAHLSSWQQADTLLAVLQAALQEHPGASCCRLESPREQRNSTLVLKNLPFALRHDQLMRSLKLLAVSPCYTRYHHDDRGMFKGIAFIKFHCRAAAERAKFQIEQLEVAGRKVRVEFKNKPTAASGRHGQPPRGSPYSPPISATSPSMHGQYPSPSLSGSSGTPPMQLLGQPAHPLESRPQHGEEAFAKEWEARLGSLAQDTTESTFAAVPRRSLTAAREEVLRDICRRKGLIIDSRGSTRDAVYVRTGAGYAAIYGCIPPQQGPSGSATPSSSSSPSPAMLPADRKPIMRKQSQGRAADHLIPCHSIDRA